MHGRAAGGGAGVSKGTSTRATREQAESLGGEETEPKHRHSTIPGRKFLGGEETELVVSEADAESELIASLPALPSGEELARLLLQKQLRTVERFLRDRLRPDVARLVGVGHEALYAAVQLVAELDAFIVSTPERAKVLLAYLGVNPKRKKRTLELVHSLFGLPDARLVGKEARQAVQTRHSTYAKAIDGSRHLGIAPDDLAAELKGRGGLDGLAEIARRKACQEQAASDSGPEDDAEGEAAPDTPSKEPLGAAETFQEKPALRTSELIEFAAAPDVMHRLVEGDGFALCLIDRDVYPPEVLGGVPLPSNCLHDAEAALAWLKEAIATAAGQDKRSVNKGSKRHSGEHQDD